MHTTHNNRVNPPFYYLCCCGAALTSPHCKHSLRLLWCLLCFSSQLKSELSKKVGLPTGPVLKVFAADRRQMKTLEDFEDGGLYICCGAEKLKEDLSM